MAGFMHQELGCNRQVRVPGFQIPDSGFQRREELDSGSREHEGRPGAFTFAFGFLPLAFCPCRFALGVLPFALGLLVFSCRLDLGARRVDDRWAPQGRARPPTRVSEDS
jgi:hypothetical protein